MGKGERMIYTILNEPVTLSSVRVYKKRVWDDAQQLTFAMRTNLELQHNGAPLYYKPIMLDLIFCLSRKGARNKAGHPFIDPDLSDLVEFVEYIANGVIWNDTRIISRIVARKEFSSDAKTIIEVHNVL